MKAPTPPPTYSYKPSGKFERLGVRLPHSWVMFTEVLIADRWYVLMVYYADEENSSARTVMGPHTKEINAMT